MAKLTVLFSSAGRRVELINCFRQATERLGLDLEVIAIDMNPSWSPACQVADRHFRVPRCTEEDFPNIVASICEQCGVDLIVPTIDTELLIYAKNRNILAEVGTEVLISSEAFVEVARDKKATAAVLSAHNIPVPRTWTISDALENETELPFPILLKPRAGSRSEGVAIIENREKLNGGKLDDDHFLFQEICTGREFTVNCFYDRSGALAACVPHFRKLVRDGEVCFAQTERVPAFTAIAQKFSDIFEGLWGALCFQGFVGNSGSVKIFEINARFGGGYPICDQAGGTFARWILQDLSGQHPDYHDNWREGVRMLRYDASVFI